MFYVVKACILIRTHKYSLSSFQNIQHQIFSKRDFHLKRFLDGLLKSMNIQFIQNLINVGNKSVKCWSCQYIISAQALFVIWIYMSRSRLLYIYIHTQYTVLVKRLRLVSFFFFYEIRDYSARMNYID